MFMNHQDKQLYKITSWKDQSCYDMKQMKGAFEKTVALLAFLVAPPSWDSPYSLGGDGMIVT